MNERWRDTYDFWKQRKISPLDEDGEPVDQDRLDAEAEAPAEARAERAREDMMFDREDRDE